MRILLLATGLILAVTSAARAGMQDDVRAGKLQCYAPNVQKKTCNSLASYAFDGGRVMNRAEVLLSPDPAVVMMTNSPVEFRGDVICGRIAKADIDGAVIMLNGQTLGDAQANAMRAQIWQALSPRAGKEVCTTYAPAGAAFTATVTVDGQPDPTPPITVMLVSPNDGYRAAP